MVEILCDMLWSPFESELFDIKQLLHTDPMTKICWLIYRILKHLVIDNRLNEEYQAQWLGLFFEQAMNIH